MRRILVLALLVLIVLPIAASAEEVQLQADIEHGVVLFDGPTRLYVHWVGGQVRERNNVLILQLPVEDVARFCPSESGRAYIVVEYNNIDGLVGRPPRLQLQLPGIRNYPWLTLSTGGQWEHVAEPARVEWSVSCRDLRKATTLSILLGADTAGLNMTAVNDWLAVTVERVILAPPQGLAQHVQEQPMAGQWHGFDAKIVAIAAAGGLVLGVVLMQVAARRR